jgi:hypothetical protein
LAIVFAVMLNWSAAAALVRPPSITLRTIASQPFGVRGAVLWLFIWSLRGTLKLRNLSFLGSDQMDNLLKAKPAASNACGGPIVMAQSFRLSR